MREKGITDDRYIILSVTLDPEYDTDERINQYKELFEITRSELVIFTRIISRNKEIYTVL